MWVLFDGGFVSIVRKDCKPTELLVRARVRKDLVAFCQLAGVLKARTNIVRTNQADYRFRVVLHEKYVGQALVKIATNIDYGNFKSRVSARHGDERAHVYGHVWTDLYQLQYKSDGAFGRYRA